MEALEAAARSALAYAAGIDDRDVTPSPEAVAALDGLDGTLPESPSPTTETLELLARLGGPATMATTGPRYFGFVNGATHPAALGAAMLVSAWDQNAGLPAMSPVSARLHDITRRWLLDVLTLDPATDVAFVTGATMANAACMAAARDALLAARGWDAQRDGLFGAPPLQVVVGAAAHSTLRKSLGLIGLGRDRVVVVPADDQGRMRADALPDLDPADGPVLCCAQAGEVNTGAFDPFTSIRGWVSARDGWLHVDGAFGLWALADPGRRDLTAGLDLADSLATDGHKWLNVTYDCGIVFVRRPGALRATFAADAGYLPATGGFEAMHNTPQSSQRARQVEVWAVLRTLGRSGVADLVRRAGVCASRIADRLRGAGLTVLNDVVLNQVLVRYGDGPATERLIDAVQHDGRIWCGPTRWDGATAMRISVSSWKTTLADADLAADVILACADALAGGRTSPQPPSWS